MLRRLCSVVVLLGVLGFSGRASAFPEHLFGWITKISQDTIEISTNDTRAQMHTVKFDSHTQFMLLSFQKPLRRTPADAQSLRVGQRVWMDVTSDNPPRALVVKIG